MARLAGPARRRDQPGNERSRSTGTAPQGGTSPGRSRSPARATPRRSSRADRIFLVSCREDRQDRILLCLDRTDRPHPLGADGVNSPLEKKHRLNSYASSTPATDGKLVYVTFALDPTVRKGDTSFTTEKQATSVDPARWSWPPTTSRAGNSGWSGRASSPASTAIAAPPVLFENLVIVNGDHDGDAYLVALDRATGKTVWKTPRENKTRSYCTPIIRQIDGRTQMILSGSKCVASYDPRDGSRHWIIDGPTEQFVASLVYNGKLLFMTAGFPELHILAIRPDGHGNVTKTHVVWHTTKGCSYVPSPIVAGGGKYFLVVSDNGIASCFEAARRQAALDGADRAALQRLAGRGRRAGPLPLRRRHDDDRPPRPEVRRGGREPAGRELLRLAGHQPGPDLPPGGEAPVLHQEVRTTAGDGGLFRSEKLSLWQDVTRKSAPSPSPAQQGDGVHFRLAPQRDGQPRASETAPRPRWLHWPPGITMAV